MGSWRCEGALPQPELRGSRQLRGQKSCLTAGMTGSQLAVRARPWIPRPRKPVPTDALRTGIGARERCGSPLDGGSGARSGGCLALTFAAESSVRPHVSARRPARFPGMRAAGKAGALMDRRAVRETVTPAGRAERARRARALVEGVLGPGHPRWQRRRRRPEMYLACTPDGRACRRLSRRAGGFFDAYPKARELHRTAKFDQFGGCPGGPDAIRRATRGAHVTCGDCTSRPLDA